ncbi:hypothetical protein PC116_g632 [Phytophthora cactorum]|nr:hypothetical protein PC116_g632 [Phytophthora cactorum]
MKVVVFELGPPSTLKTLCVQVRDIPIHPRTTTKMSRDT